MTSHRRPQTADATARWLEQIGLPVDDLHCSFDKVSRCVDLGIDVLVDDSPVNIARAREAGIVAATIIHPWNEEVVEPGRRDRRARLDGAARAAGSRAGASLTDSKSDGRAHPDTPLAARDTTRSRRRSCRPTTCAGTSPASSRSGA